MTKIRDENRKIREMCLKLRHLRHIFKIEAQSEAQSEAQEIFYPKVNPENSTTSSHTHALKNSFGEMIEQER